MILYISLILFSLRKCRIYDDIYTIREALLGNISKLNISFEINGTNDYKYKFKKKNIYFKYDRNITDNINDSIKIINPKITILFDLIIYEYSKDLFDIFSLRDSIITDKIIIANINMKSLTYFKKSKDFSFDLKYYIESIEKNVSISFDNLSELSIFKYLIFNEKSILYENKTFYDYLKIVVKNNLIKEMTKALIYYPECDSLYYFKYLINYLIDNRFFVNYDCTKYNNRKVIDYATLRYISYEEILKNETSIELKNIKCNLFTEFINYDYVYEDTLEKFEIGNIIISNNLIIKYGNTQSENQCYLDILEIIINRAKEQYKI